MDDLQDIPIGTVLKNYYGPSFHEAWNAGKLQIQEVALDELNFRKLMRGRVKLVPANLFAGYYFLRTNFTQQEAEMVTHHPQPLKTSVYHVLFSKAVKENESRMKLFNQGLRQLKKSGAYEALLKKFNLREYQISREIIGNQ